ncbi:hypothetical protein AVEN_78289-1 [Araneus ventricosus]|uniref:Uncharacterized protein n=1 Tax=Araneus ventricosus TaxID=182803 RepID=A0A4Y2FFL9_ARAVE|nr:hypothetical protein AVEN_78289-1 [Araneus ventricosus]
METLTEMWSAIEVRGVITFLLRKKTPQLKFIGIWWKRTERPTANSLNYVLFVIVFLAGVIEHPPSSLNLAESDFRIFRPLVWTWEISISEPMASRLDVTLRHWH